MREPSALDGLLLLESLPSTEWFDAIADEVDGDSGELLRAIGRDATDHAEELRRVLDLWEREGGDASRRLRRRAAEELVGLARDARRRAASALLDASERAPTAEISYRLRALAREARGHAERLDEDLAGRA